MKRILPEIKTSCRDEGGQALVIAVLSMTVLMGFLGLAIDVGNVRSAERKLQQAADAAALAGALEMTYCTYNSTTFCVTMQNAASAAVTENGLATPTVTTNQGTNSCSTPTISGVTLLLNWGPCLVANDPNAKSGGNENVVEAQVGELYPVYFAGLLGISNPVAITVRAEASRTNTSYCEYVDTKDWNSSNTAGSGQLVLDAGSHTTLNCGVQDDGQLTAHNGAHLTATQFEVTASSGGSSNSFNPAPAFNAPMVRDPICTSYSSITIPSGSVVNMSGYTTTGTCRSQTATYNQPTCSSWTTLSNPYTGTTLSPGCYAAPSTGCTPVSVNSGNSYDNNSYCDAVNLGSDVTMSSGVYVFYGDFDINGRNVTGNGVTLYFQQGSVLNGNGGQVTLTAPTSNTSTTTGFQGNDYEAMLIWEAPTDTNSMELASGSSSTWTGIIYAPDATLDLSDGANVSAGCTGSNTYTIMDAYQIVDTGGSKVFNQCFNFSSLSDGNPIRSQTAVLVE